jgi:hypothetical protein
VGPRCSECFGVELSASTRVEFSVRMVGLVIRRFEHRRTSGPWLAPGVKSGNPGLGLFNSLFRSCWWRRGSRAGGGGFLTLVKAGL